MTDQNNSTSAPNGGRTLASIIQFAGVALVCGVIGFAAVYATLGSPAIEDRGALPQSAPTGSSDAAARQAPGQPEALPTGPGKNALSVGEMAMFVWRPEAIVYDGVAFRGPDGGDLSLTSFQGKVVLLNLWATWCAPCRKEMPDLDELQSELGGDEFEVVAVSLDRGSDAAPKAFLDEIGIKALRFFHDPSAKLGAKLKAIGMPATLLIDRQGREIGRLVGPANWASEDAKRLIRVAIASGA